MPQKQYSGLCIGKHSEEYFFQYKRNMTIPTNFRYYFGCRFLNSVKAFTGFTGFFPEGKNLYFCEIGFFQENVYIMKILFRFS